LAGIGGVFTTFFATAYVIIKKFSNLLHVSSISRPDTTMKIV